MCNANLEDANTGSKTPNLPLKYYLFRIQPIIELNHLPIHLLSIRVCRRHSSSLIAASAISGALLLHSK